MQKYEIKKAKPQLQIGEKFGCLTICSEPYYIIKQGGGHRRQHFDMKCDCGNIREAVNGMNFKGGISILTYCSRDCPLYLDALPKDVPEDSKLCKVGEQYNYLTVTKEAFYYSEKGSSNRHKYVEVQCKCGKLKKYRESKVYNGSFKSCGCVWESRDRSERCWDYLEKTYNITKKQFGEMLEKSNNKCYICNKDQTPNKISNTLFVDHCHNTGKVRGLLCFTCNAGLGNFKDNIENLKNAIKYLENQ